jgi:predicted Zn-dependent protease
MTQVRIDDCPTKPVLSRRQFLGAACLAALPLAGLGCAVDPVTGQKQFMLMNRDQEIAVDRQQSPFQFSSDYGVSQDAALNRYISDVGQALVPGVHRQDMPYNFHCVNATYVNAYAFPGGSIAATRGILLELDNEAELAALLGHELGHVNARHAAEQQTKGQVSAIVISGLSAAANAQGAGMGEVAQQLGALGQGLFLARYSRDNEREADALGHEYMIDARYNSKGFVGLMEMLEAMHTSRQTSFDMLFATHPMSRERLDTAVQRDRGPYRHTHEFSLNRDRYMDRTAGLRQLKPAIEFMQEGEKYLGQKKYHEAEKAFARALKTAEHDYTGQVLMAKCMMLQKKHKAAQKHAAAAKQLYPEESQAHYLSGVANLSLKRPGKAFEDFKRCDALLPGNPQITFYQGYALDMDGQKPPAARQYAAYLNAVNYAANAYSQHAYKRLKAWGYVK